jgi:hypothetical protein
VGEFALVSESRLAEVEEIVESAGSIGDFTHDPRVSAAHDAVTDTARRIERVETTAAA